MFPTRPGFPIISRAAAEAATRDAQTAELGALPEWNLSDLYPAMDSPAFAGDLAKADADCAAFNAAYRGQIESLAKDKTGAALTEAIRRYEALEELLGRVSSYAGLIYAGDTSDPARG